jgi:hypothetical protein
MALFVPDSWRPHEDSMAYLSKFGPAAGIAAVLVWLASLIGAPLQAQPAASLAAIVPFKVFAADGKTPLYLGEYRVERNGAEIAESERYQTPQGKLAKLDESVYDAERRRPVSFSSANYLTGEVFRVTVKGDALSWRSEDAAGALKSSAEDSVPSGTFLWPNLAHLLSQEWEKIAGGQPVSVGLYVVSHKMKVGVDLKPDGPADVGGVPGIRVKIQPSSLLFRQLAGDAWMTLAVEPPHRVLRFEGKGVVKGADGKDVASVIVFDWALAQAGAPPCALVACSDVPRPPAN